jgi:hypothetical protein
VVYIDPAATALPPTQPIDITNILMRVWESAPIEEKTSSRQGDVIEIVSVRH